MQFDQSVVDLLLCPVTRSKLRLESGPAGDFLISAAGGLKYPIRDGIPVLLPQEAILPDGYKTLDEFKSKFGVTAS